MNDNDRTQLQEPQEGGSYRRNQDGSLTLLEQTQQRGGRAARAQLLLEAAAAAPESTAAPAPWSPAARPTTDNSQE